MPDTTNSTPAMLTWIHSDPRGMANAENSAFLRAASMRWTPDADSVADLRALVVSCFSNVSALGPTPPLVQDGSLVVYPNRSKGDTSAQAWQDAVMAGVAVLLGNPGTKYSLDSSVRIQTQGGATPAPLETGFPFLGAVVLVAVVGAIAAVVVDWLDQSNQIEAIKISTDAHVAEHAATLASANQIIDAHLSREHVSGQSIPWDAQELEQLERLRNSTRTLTEWKAPELRPGPVGGAVGGAVSDVGKGAADAARSAGTGIELGLFALIALLAFESFGSRRDRRAAA